MKAKLGQNFLVDAGAQRAIADALGDTSTQTVVEIGPGRGAITDLLARRAGLLIAVELDSNLAAALRTRFLLRHAADDSTADRVQNQVRVLEQDILRLDLTKLATQLQPEMPSSGLLEDQAPAAQPVAKLAIVGNLPYYITSDILLHLFAHHAVISRAVLMVQREVADRIVAEPGTRDYGMLAATCQLYVRAERLFTLSPASFSPSPLVHSSVVRLTFAPRFAELGVDPAAFTAHLRVCFAQKRKTLANNLRAAGYTAQAVAAALEQARIPPQARAETLSLGQQADLFHAFTMRASLKLQ